VSSSPGPQRELRELQAGDTRLAHAAMRALRLVLEDPEEFARHVDEELRPGGYRLIGAFVPEQAQAVAAAGFRTGASLAWGRYLYIDDLSALPGARRQGHGAALLDWLLEEADRLRCGQVHLDSGLGADRFDAHRLYHAHGFSIYAHHFARGII
jgi:GNAT superfamily N-acetyltransferase